MDSQKVRLLPLIKELKLNFIFSLINIESNVAFMQKPRNLVNAFNFHITYVLYCCCCLEVLIVPLEILFGLMCSSAQQGEFNLKRGSFLEVKLMGCVGGNMYASV